MCACILFDEVSAERLACLVRAFNSISKLYDYANFYFISVTNSRFALFELCFYFCEIHWIRKCVCVCERVKAKDWKIKKKMKN